MNKKENTQSSIVQKYGERYRSGNFLVIPKRFIKDLLKLPIGVSRLEKDVLLVLIDYTALSNSKICWPSYDTIVSEVVMDRKNLSRILASLEKKGLITIKRGRPGRGVPNHYDVSPVFEMIGDGNVVVKWTKDEIMKRRPFLLVECVTLFPDIVTLFGAPAIVAYAAEYANYDEMYPSDLDRLAVAVVENFRMKGHIDP